MSSSNTIQLPVCSNNSKEKDTNQQQSLSYKATNTSRIKNFFWNKLTRPRGGSIKNITISNSPTDNENNNNNNEKKQKKNLLLTFFESSSSKNNKNNSNKKSTKKV
jgi:hypothetical protein